MSSFLKILTSQDFRDYLKLGNFLNKDIALLKSYRFFPAFFFDRFNSETVTTLELYTLEGCLIGSLGTSSITSNANYIYTNGFYNAEFENGKYFYYKITTSERVLYSEIFELYIDSNDVYRADTTRLTADTTVYKADYSY